MPETATTTRVPVLPAPPPATSVPALLGRLAQGSRPVFRSASAWWSWRVLWQVLPSEHVVDPTFVSPLSQVLSTWWHLATDGTLWANASVSLVRAGVGFGIAIASGCRWAWLIGWHRRVAADANPVLELFRNTAPLALLPVFILILGIGQTSKFAVRRLRLPVADPAEHDQRGPDR